MSDLDAAGLATGRDSKMVLPKSCDGKVRKSNVLHRSTKSRGDTINKDHMFLSDCRQSPLNSAKSLSAKTKSKTPFSVYMTSTGQAYIPTATHVATPSKWRILNLMQNLCSLGTNAEASTCATPAAPS
ncbi:MAG: hypothetical protein ACI87E_001414, partial [Mariniblastus sp.]